MQDSDNPMWDLMKRELTLLQEYHIGQGVGDNMHTVNKVTPIVVIHFRKKSIMSSLILNGCRHKKTTLHPEAC